MIQPIDQDECVARLRPLSTLVAQCLVRANTRSRWFFSSQNLPYEAFTFTTIHRYHMKLLLMAAKYVVVDECEVGVETKNLPNIGLQVIHDGISSKILKATRINDIAVLPPPRTDARIAYYSQQLELIFGSDGNAIYTVGNVAYIWEDDPKSHELTHAWLVWPKSAVKGQVVEAWREEIPLPPTQSNDDWWYMQPTAPPPPRPDLPIEIPLEDVQSDSGD